MKNIEKTADHLKDLMSQGLLDGKALDVKSFDVRGLTSIADFMLIASGQSTRQVKALSERVCTDAKAAGYSILGTEGENTCQWVLVDAGDVLVHIMHPDAREFYQLERLWSDYSSDH
jgi:ribosome-associated protein